MFLTWRFTLNVEGIKLGRGAKWSLPCSIPGRAEPGQWPGFLDDPETLMSQYASQVSKVFASRILPRFRVHPRCCARNRWDSWRLHSSFLFDFSTSASQFLQRSSFSRENVLFAFCIVKFCFPFSSVWILSLHSIGLTWSFGFSSTYLGITAFGGASFGTCSSYPMVFVAVVAVDWLY